MRLAKVAGPVLRRLPAETAHRAAINGLKIAPPAHAPACDPRLSVEVLGLKFPNPLGLAAGFDKNAEVPGAMLRLGFGFVEVGTLTPRPQGGNARPRLFRLREDAAVINRYGFNNEGFERARARLERRPPGLIGVNLGANKDAADRVEDYTLGVRTFAAFADYLTINISSPNTPGLRDLQRREALDDLIARVVEARDETEPRRPLMLKIAPDLDASGLEDIVATALTRRIDGLIVSNTTVARPASLTSRNRGESGGLSGRPLFEPSTRLLARAYLLTGGAMPLIGCGGVEDPETAIAKIEAGANLVQLYTGLALKGHGVVEEILEGLSRAVEARGLNRIGELVGARRAPGLSGSARPPARTRMRASPSLLASPRRSRAGARSTGRRICSIAARKSKQIQGKKLGFPWIPLAETGLFNGLQRIQTKKSSSVSHCVLNVSNHPHSAARGPRARQLDPTKRNL